MKRLTPLFPLVILIAITCMMGANSYFTKVYHKQGGDELVVGSSGQITVESGGTIDNDGAYISPLEVFTASDTLVAADSGKTCIAGAANVKWTLPATVAGYNFTFIMSPVGLGTSASQIMAIDPNASDKIMGWMLVTGVDNKDLQLKGDVDGEGDSVTIVGDGVYGWYITSGTGSWNQES